MMVSFISMAEARAWQLNESMDQLYEPKENGHKLRDAAEIPNPGHDELGGGPQLCPRLHTFISDPVEAQVDVVYGLVHPERVGEGLQSWHKAKAKWTADSWAFHCSCAACSNYLHYQLAVPNAKIVTRAHSCHILTSPSSPLYSRCLHSDLLPPFFNNENTFRNHIPRPERG